MISDTVGGKMTKEQADEEFRKILRKTTLEEERILQEAREKGILKPGLDSNKELFSESYENMKRQIELLKEMMDELE